MPKSAVTREFELSTRNVHTKVDCEVVIKVDGRELPSTTILGDCLDKTIEMVQATVTESYKVIPPRLTTV